MISQIPNFVRTVVVFNQPPRSTQPGHPFMGTSDGHGHCCGRNGEFCVISRDAPIRYWLIIGRPIIGT